MAARKQGQRRMSAQVVEDEDYQLRYEVVAGIDVAKESAVVCVRMPPAAGRKHRTSQLQAVPATVPAITGLAAELRDVFQGQRVNLLEPFEYHRFFLGRGVGEVDPRDFVGRDVGDRFGQAFQAAALAGLIATAVNGDHLGNPGKRK